MGLFKLFQAKPNGEDRFVSEKDFKLNLSKQAKMTPMTMEQLRKYDVTEDKELKLEYFFYTDTNDKAKALTNELQENKYEAQFGVSASDKKLFIITGWTTRMKMTDEVVINWAKQMCETGYKYDCEFDGWGTDPGQ